ncbi:MAG: MoaD/ThiS family protein [Gammaproteobacteria bacterium]|nr:MoaD/ThiS family protein [Gammaproteobacteria bacterium]
MKVVFFASLREDMGIEEIFLQLPEGCTTDSLLEVLSARLGEKAVSLLCGDSVRIAVNQEMLDGRAHLFENDEVAYFPRITGG